MNWNLRRIAALLCLILFILSSSAFADDLKSRFYPAKVKDISDRGYEPAVIQLLDNAKESIVISMYILKPLETGPVRLLVRDLEEALDRGVSVEIYLNMVLDGGISQDDIINKPLRDLSKKGARIYKASASTRLHDKLIIVDGRFIVDGSTNWTVSALKKNHESAVLIESPDIAKVKLMRLRRLPLEGDDEDNKKRPDRPRRIEPLPDGAIVGVKKELLNNKYYFAAMLRQGADRAMDAYLLLLAESTRLGKKEFFIPLEEMAVAIGMSPELSYSVLRRQAAKELRALQDRHKLIDVNFGYGKDAWIELKELQGVVFNVNGRYFDPKYLVSRSQPAKYVVLIKALLEAEGASIDSFSERYLARRFNINRSSIDKGLKEIREK